MTAEGGEKTFRYAPPWDSFGLGLIFALTGLPIYSVFYWLLGPFNEFESTQEVVRLALLAVFGGPCLCFGLTGSLLAVVCLVVVVRRLISPPLLTLAADHMRLPGGLWGNRAIPYEEMRFARRVSPDSRNELVEIVYGPKLDIVTISRMDFKRLDFEALLAELRLRAAPAFVAPPPPGLRLREYD